MSELLILLAVVLGFFLGRWTRCPEEFKEDYKETLQAISKKLKRTKTTIHDPEEIAKAVKFKENFEDESL